MKFKFAQVPLTELQAPDTRLRITTNTRIDDLCRSLAQDGLINPPILRGRAHQWLMVSGFRRLAAVRKLGWECLPARLLPADADDAVCVRYAVADNALQRPLNLVESARALNLLSSVYADTTDMMRRAAAYGLPTSSVQIERLQSLLKLPDAIQTAVLHEQLGLAMALELAAHDAREALALLELFTSLQLSLNRQREFMGLVRDIARRERRSLSDMLQTADFAAICRNEELERPRRVALARHWLRQRRYPHLVAAETHFENGVRRLQWGPAVQLHASPGFESPDYTITLTFRSPAELAGQLDAIRRDLRHPALAAILER